MPVLTLTPGTPVRPIWPGKSAADTDDFVAVLDPAWVGAEAISAAVVSLSPGGTSLTAASLSCSAGTVTLRLAGGAQRTWYALTFAVELTDGRSTRVETALYVNGSGRASALPISAATALAFLPTSPDGLPIGSYYRPLGTDVPIMVIDPSEGGASPSIPPAPWTLDLPNSPDDLPVNALYRPLGTQIPLMVIAPTETPA